MTPARHSADGIAALLSDGNGTMVKRFLEAHGAPRGAGDSIAELAERIANYRSDERLSEAALEQLFREVIEFGEKRFYMFRGDAAQMRRVRSEHFGGRGVTALRGVRIQRRPTAPALNYALVTEAHIRLNFTETHSFVRAVRATRGWTSTDKTRAVVIDADLSTGVVSIAFDTPGEHDHGENASSFFDYYIENEAPALLNTQLVPLEYFNLLRTLEHERHRNLIRSGAVRGLDDQGMGMDFRPQGVADLRDYENFQGNRAKLALRKSARVIWKATAPKPTLPDVREGKALLREVSTEIFGSPGLIRFGRHTLSHEVEYVLQNIRSLA